METPNAFVGPEAPGGKTDVVVSIEIKPRLGNFPKEDKEPVKLLVIGSKQAIQAVVQGLHMCGFAEIFEWTNFMPAPTPERPLRCKPGEFMKVLVKYFSKV